MTVYEALKLCGGVIDRLEKAGVKPSDHKYIAMFEEYWRAKQRGDKVSYIVACLAEQYDMSERGVYDVLKRLGTDCKTASL